MKSNRKQLYKFAALAGLILAGAGLAPLQAGETNLINNSAFDNLSPSPAWAWENWSLAGSTASYDGTRDAGGGAVGSGSLRLVAPYATLAGWQQAVYTIDSVNFDASGYYSIAFDVKVDPSSTLSGPRTNANLEVSQDYGYFQVILRDGGNWDWRELAFVTLTNTSWQRYTIALTNGPGGAVSKDAIKNIQAITIRMAQNDMVGPVTVNVDNFALNDEVAIDNFNDGDIAGWINDWGTTPETGFTNLDFYGRVTSGSFRFASPWPLTPADDWEQVVPAVTFPAALDISTLFTRVSMDIMVLPGSTPDVGGDYGLVEIKLPGGSALPPGLTPTNTGVWNHLSCSIPAGLSGIGSFLFQVGHGDWVGPTAYVIDNVSFTPRLSTPPPTVSIRRQAAKGLKITDSDIDTFQRQSIAAISTAAQAVTWIDNPEIVTYSFTIAERSQSGNNFQVHLMLNPDSGNNNSPDYSDANCVFLDIRNNGATFRSKTNQANGNGQLYAAGNPTLAASSMLGTWSLSFQNNTNITITGPGGSSTNFIMDPAKAQLYKPVGVPDLGVPGSLTATLGCQPNNVADIGGNAIFTMFKCTVGATTVFEDHFTQKFDTTEVDPALFVRRGPSVAGIVVTTNTGWVVKWGVPDTDFVLVSSTDLNLGNAGFTPLVVPVTQAGNNKEALITDADLPAGSKVFFALRKP